MKRFFAVLLLVCVLLSGCAGWMDGHYHNASLYEDNRTQQEDDDRSVGDYSELCEALREMIRNGTESGIISVADYDQSRVAEQIRMAVPYVLKRDPIAAYAVESLDYEVGTSNGQAAIAVTITYLHDRTEIRQIKHMEDLTEAKEAIYKELDQCADGIVLSLDDYTGTDFTQLVEDYANDYPQKVIEMPQVSVNMYPESGANRVIEIRFEYQTSRDSLRGMQAQVGTLFDAAADYVSATVQTREKFSQMYAFLMERFQSYQIETSITPAYSLLLHGVGDARSFAVVYAAMCREAGLQCRVLTGTRSGESWCWNLVNVNGSWYHVDLLRCNEQGWFRLCDANQMDGYVWDYSAYSAQ